MLNRGWMKRFSLGLGLALLGVLAVGPPAGATTVQNDPGLEGSVVCSTDSNGNPIQLITWIVTNFNLGTDMTFQAISLTQGTLVPNPSMSGETFAVGQILPAGQAAWANTTLPGSFVGSDTLTVTGVWPASNDYTSTNSVTVNLAGCGGGGTPNVSVSKTADATSVSAGTSIGFTVTVSNSGTGEATGVELTDSLPGGPTPVHWVIDGGAAGTNPGSFSITGADGSQVLSLAGQPVTLAAGASLSVHVTAATGTTSCGTYNNTAEVSTTNDGSATASASTAVTNCEVGHLAPTNTTCSMYASGSYQGLDTIWYSTRHDSDIVNQTNPGVFFYWIKVGGGGTYTISQANDYVPFMKAAGSNVFDSNCSAVNGASIVQSSPSGNVTVTFTGTGDFYIGIKYSTSDGIVGTAAPGTGTADYHFETSKLGSGVLPTSGDDLTLKPKV